jgi:hypothetical protein
VPVRFLQLSLKRTTKRLPTAWAQHTSRHIALLGSILREAVHLIASSISHGKLVAASTMTRLGGPSSAPPSSPDPIPEAGVTCTPSTCHHVPRGVERARKNKSPGTTRLQQTGTTMCCNLPLRDLASQQSWMAVILAHIKRISSHLILEQHPKEGCASSEAGRLKVHKTHMTLKLSGQRPGNALPVPSEGLGNRPT